MASKKKYPSDSPRHKTTIDGRRGNHARRLFQLSEQSRVARAQIASNNVAVGNTIAEIEMKNGVASGNAIAGGDHAFTEEIGSPLKAVSSGGMQYMSYKMLELFLEKLEGKKNAETPAFDEGARQEALGNGIVIEAPIPVGTAMSNQTGVTWTSNAF